jgi:hypothetical protein
MSQYIINIVDTPKGGKRVRPAKLTVEGRDAIEWKNTLSTTVQLTLQRGDEIFEGFPGAPDMKVPPPLPAYTIVISPAGSARFAVLARPLHGDHAYQVQDPATGDFYNGDSDPRIDVL